jgi:hypothetical protein
MPLLLLLDTLLLLQLTLLPTLLLNLKLEDIPGKQLAVYR